MDVRKDELVSRYLYKSPYVKDIPTFRQEILEKRFIPHQVEVQPGPLGNKICWLNCPYCYGKSAINSPERLSHDRYLEVLNQIVDGGCKKFIFAGWATDPLYYKHIDDLVDAVSSRGAIIGFNTRAIDVSDRLVEIVANANVTPKSYMSISVNAATNDRYNEVNGVESGKPKLYDRVVANVNRILTRRKETNASLDISVSYLLNQYTSGLDEVTKFIRDFKGIGVDLIRFSCPQIPRGDTIGENLFIPSPDEYRKYIAQLEAVVEAETTESCKILVTPNEGMFLKARTTPCFARFIYPTIGYDGWLYHCSQSAGSNFRSQALGNLATHDFWDLLYDYDAANLGAYFKTCEGLMNANGCRCDRKEHTVNTTLNENGFFDTIPVA